MMNDDVTIILERLQMIQNISMKMKSSWVLMLAMLMLKVTMVADNG